MLEDQLIRLEMYFLVQNNPDTHAQWYLLQSQKVIRWQSSDFQVHVWYIQVNMFLFFFLI